MCEFLGYVGHRNKVISKILMGRLSKIYSSSEQSLDSEMEQKTEHELQATIYPQLLHPALWVLHGLLRGPCNHCHMLYRLMIDCGFTSD